MVRRLEGTWETASLYDVGTVSQINSLTIIPHRLFNNMVSIPPYSAPLILMFSFFVST